ncbi:MAG: class I SAM-dependent methyltransferase [Actinomycetota bacterium]
MAKKVKALTARVGTLVKQRVRYTGWSTDLNAFVAKRLENPRPTKVKTIEWLTREPLLEDSFSLLDIGCGPGVFARMLELSALSERVRYTGVDQSEDALRHCRSTLPPSYNFIQRDVLREGVPEGQFDVIVINEVVEHMPNYRDLIDAALAKHPKVLVITAFAVLPEQAKDRYLWNANYTCYMNTYSFNGFHQYLREKSGRPVQILDLGSESDETAEFPRKALILFYLPQADAAA